MKHSPEFYIANSIERILMQSDKPQDKRLKIECIARVILESDSAEAIHAKLIELCNTIESKADLIGPIQGD